MAPLKVYVASITANPEIRKRVQRTLMLLEGMGIPFDAIDITKPGNEEHRYFMRENALKEGEKATPLPPQFFYNDDYLGNFVDFDEAVEDDRMTEFLRLVPNSKPPPATTKEKANKEEADSDKENQNGDEEAEDEEGAEKAEDEEGVDEEEEGADEEVEGADEAEEAEAEGEDEEYDEEEQEDEGTTQATFSLKTPAKAEETKEEKPADAPVKDEEEGEGDEEEGEDEEWDEDEEYEEEEEGEE